MAERQQVHQVGAPDPELRNSPIMEESAEDYEDLSRFLEDASHCYFNGTSYKDGSFICSGSGELLHCERGVWVNEGGCAPENP